MKRKIKIPTGFIVVNDYSKGELETLSIGDYGKRHNVKADFLGYTRPVGRVPNMECMPLSEKWVVTLSTQYGCPMACRFCDVPKVRYRGNASFVDLREELEEAIACFPHVRYTERLNIHFARMGEPIMNPAVLQFAEWLGCHGKLWLQDALQLRTEVVHPVLTTMAPRVMGEDELCRRLSEWCDIKNEVFNGTAGLQLSVNSTSEKERYEMFSGRQASLDTMSRVASRLPRPLGRKYCLNFAFSSGSTIDEHVLSGLFSSRDWMVKITPIHNNTACRVNGYETVGGYDSWDAYRDVYDRLSQAGWDVLVFVPSLDEEHGLVTCGNAVLGGSELKTGEVELIDEAEVC